MIPFNLEEALADKPLVCRNGKLVTQFVEFKNTEAIHCLVGVCDDMIMHWTINGFCHTADGLKPSEWDLFMAPEKQSVWINVYQGDFSKQLCVIAHCSLEQAIEHKSPANGFTYIKTVEITNEL
jgi:hypothetical protein